MTGLDTDERLQLIKKYGTNPYSGLLLYQDFAVFPLTSAEGFIGYRNGHRMLLVMGEPVCAPEHYRVAMQEFIEYCKQVEKPFIQICCGAPYKETVKELDLSSFLIGDVFVFDVSTYQPKGERAKPARWAKNRAIRAGASVKEYDPRYRPDPALEAALQAVARRWMKKNTQFTAHLIDLKLFENRNSKRYFYSEVGGIPVAMITCLPIFGQQGYLFEDVIRDPQAPYGSIELITLTIMDCLKAEGGKMATFGISPRLDANGLTGTSRILVKTGMMFAERIFQLHQLYHFREKFSATFCEPSFLLKYPKGFNLIDVVRIIGSF